jgi:protein TonB
MENVRGGVFMSDLGSLSQCLVDSDSDARVRARRLRGKAVVLSLVLEALLVAAMLLWPLVAPSVLNARYEITPTPPYLGGGGAHHPHTVSQHPSTSPMPPICLAVCAPVVRPSAPASDSEPPDFNQNESEKAGNGSGPGILGTGPGVPDSPYGREFVPEPPPVEKSHTRPTRMSEGVMAALLIRRVDPAYPAIAKAAHIDGVVHLHAIIGKDGTVRELEVVDGNGLLAQAARAGVQNWRYQPTRLNGEPVEVETYITVNFLLN